MKNKLSVLVMLAALFLAVAGCSLGGLTGSDDESSSSDTTTEESKDGESKSSGSGEDVLNSGIAECDELAKYVNDNSEEIEGTLVGKMIILMYKNTILKAIEDGTEKMSDEEKEKFGEICAKSLKQLKENESK